MRVRFAVRRRWRGFRGGGKECEFSRFEMKALLLVDGGLEQSKVCVRESFFEVESSCVFARKRGLVYGCCRW